MLRPKRPLGIHTDTTLRVFWSIRKSALAFKKRKRSITDPCHFSTERFFYFVTQKIYTVQ